MFYLGLLLTWSPCLSTLPCLSALAWSLEILGGEKWNVSWWFYSYFGRYFPSAKETQKLLGYGVVSLQPSKRNVKINLGFFLYFIFCWWNTEPSKIDMSSLLLINLLLCPMFSRFPDYLLIIQLYFPYFSNPCNTTRHINLHKPQESCLSLNSHPNCRDAGSPCQGRPSGQCSFPHSLWDWV